MKIIVYVILVGMISVIAEASYLNNSELRQYKEYCDKNNAWGCVKAGTELDKRDRVVEAKKYFEKACKLGEKDTCVLLKTYDQVVNDIEKRSKNCIYMDVEKNFLEAVKKNSCKNLAQNLKITQKLAQCPKYLLEINEREQRFIKILSQPEILGVRGKVSIVNPDHKQFQRDLCVESTELSVVVNVFNILKKKVEEITNFIIKNRKKGKSDMNFSNFILGCDKVLDEINSTSKDTIKYLLNQCSKDAAIPVDKLLKKLCEKSTPFACMIYKR